VWPGTFVAEVNLSVNISTLRKHLGRSGGRQAFIQTVPKKGYRFVAPVRVRSGGTALFLHRGKKRAPQTEDAHRAYLQGRYHWNRCISGERSPLIRNMRPPTLDWLTATQLRAP
jgi:Transcriptional regulatory protein, C terminal